MKKKKTRSEGRVLGRAYNSENGARVLERSGWNIDTVQVYEKNQR